ncbi:uncharacterized protein LOC135201005 isoform X1 [Macrobrachium nipponense]|uniref:uncharacterized protein LOC135201005 isoform X1 n=1 Tax=Macrobrachium nipponense TaxID=159736 RepID=UPI0030C8A58E
MSPLSRSGASPNTLVSTGNQLLLHILVGGIVLLHFEIRHSLAFSVSLDGSPKTSSSTKPPNSPEEIEAFVKTLEYQATKGYNVSQNDLVKIDLNLLDDDTIGLEIQDGLQEEFEVVDEAQRETTNASVTAKPGPSSRQLSLIYQGVYAPDSRFNAFADGVMVNMVAEMKRKRMDPLYFRVYDRGIVEHVTARAGREGMQDGAAAVSPSVDEDTSTTTSRKGRQRGNAIGGGVIRGLTNTKRFGNAEVQIAGNSTLVRAHWLTGPLDLIVDYRAPPSITRVRTGIQAVQFDTLTVVDRFGAEMSDFKIISPLFDYMPYYGNRTLEQQKTTEQVVRHLFSNDSFMTVLMKDSFEIASYDKIIPQFGTESNYYSVLKYLFDGAQRGNARTHQPAASKGVSLPGIPSLVAAHLAGTAASSAVDKQG